MKTKSFDVMLSRDGIYVIVLRLPEGSETSLVEVKSGRVWALDMRSLERDQELPAGQFGAYSIAGICGPLARVTT